MVSVLKAKYVKADHISLSPSNKGSRFWKMLLSCIPSIYEHSKWKPKEGDISFWFDKWLGEEALVDSVTVSMPRLKLKNCWLDEGWDLDLIFRLVGPQKAQDIVSSMCGHKDGVDRLVWLPNEDGNFSTSGAWDCIRIRAPKIRWANWIWHPCLPKK